MASILIDSAILLLFGVVIFLFWQVRQGLEKVRSGQTELKTLVDGLNDATNKAQSAIQELKQATRDADEALSGKVARAKSLADELTLITEAGDNLANRLEAKLTGARARVDEEIAGRAQGEGRSDKKTETTSGDDNTGSILSALKEAR